MSQESAFYEEIVEYIRQKNPDKHHLSNKKIVLCKKHSMKKIPTDIEILLNTPEEYLEEVKPILLTKPGRTASGVAVVAVMSYPFPCPHGECAMCPSMTDDNIPQSYTGKEPATMRGIRNDFDPYLQVMNRLEQYIVTGHNPEKVELIVMGGTFISFDKDYVENFIKDSFKAMNDFSRLFYKEGTLDINSFKEFFELPGKVGSKERTESIHAKLLKLKESTDYSLEELQTTNETSKIRCVGMTIETRPDYGLLEHGNLLLKLGCTRVELGIQSVYDEALEEIERGHSAQDSIDSTKALKNLGFKLNFHVMPGLPNISKEKDIEGFKELFDNPDYRPDMIKIYPCMVLKHTKLYEKWKKGEFSPLTTQKAATLIAEFKKYIPEYVRVMRVQRDIPTYMTEEGVDKTNLRQYIEKHNPNCRCIRCREAGHVYAKKGLLPEKVKTHIKKYDASGGKEFFISKEDKDKDILLGFIRMRYPDETLRDEITMETALIRELHVYGDLAGLGEKGNVQHKGYGKELITKAEDMAKKDGKTKMVIISGVGVREYYRKLGYEKEGPYMVKNL